MSERSGPASDSPLPLDQPVDDPDRSDLLRLLIRLGLRTSAPEHVDALREAVREQAAEGL